MTSALVQRGSGPFKLARDGPAEAAIGVTLGLQLARARGDRLAIYAQLTWPKRAMKSEHHGEAQGTSHEGITLSERRPR